eukprot:SAG31_NODE_1042_length_10187_cov_54.452121_15_plen_218_part_00
MDALTAASAEKLSVTSEEEASAAVNKEREMAMIAAVSRRNLEKTASVQQSAFATHEQMLVQLRENHTNVMAVTENRHTMQVTALQSKLEVTQIQYTSLVAQIRRKHIRAHASTKRRGAVTMPHVAEGEQTLQLENAKGERSSQQQLPSSVAHGLEEPASPSSSPSGGSATPSEDVLSPWTVAATESKGNRENAAKLEIVHHADVAIARAVSTVTMLL